MDLSIQIMNGPQPKFGAVEMMSVATRVLSGKPKKLFKTRIRVIHARAVKLEANAIQDKDDR
jgi:hypothetical protein